MTEIHQMRSNARKDRLMRTERDFLGGGGRGISGKICRASVRSCPTSAARQLPHHGTFSKFKPNWWTLLICCPEPGTHLLVVQA